MTGVCTNRVDEHQVSAWCNSPYKRLMDVFFSTVLLLFASPLILLVALLIRLTSGSPIVYRQLRPGKEGRQFELLKFRTMVCGAGDGGPVLTRSGDPRVTTVGRGLRRFKIDELPQLFNVLRGDMSFVGPRPQPPTLWKSLASNTDTIFAVRPGITGAATLAFRHEEELLQPLAADEVENFYIRTLMPLKLELDLHYLARANLWTDLTLIMRSGGCLLRSDRGTSSLKRTVEILSAGCLDRALDRYHQCLLVGGHSIELVCRYIQWKQLNQKVVAVALPNEFLKSPIAGTRVLQSPELSAVLQSFAGDHLGVLLLPDCSSCDEEHIRAVCTPLGIMVESLPENHGGKQHRVS